MHKTIDGSRLAHGEYCTKRVILEIYDEMRRAMETGEPYQTRLDPPPADPRVAHGGRHQVQRTLEVRWTCELRAYCHAYLPS